jgi:hypothetical protein
VLAEDETDLLLFPPLRASWAKRGTPLRVMLSGINARRVVFGTLNVDTGHRLLFARERQRGEDFQAFLRLIQWHYRGWHVTLLLDGDSSHTAMNSQRLATDIHINLIWLPKRCPELNPMEPLWRFGKDHVCANRQYASIDDQVLRFIVYLYSLSPSQALKKAGMLSEKYWLYR